MSKSETPFRRPQAAELARRLHQPRRHIQVIAGARQVGKTTLVEEKTRNGNLRTLSRHGKLAGARAKRPELIWPKGVVGPVIVAGEIDVLPAEWREMRQVVGLRRHALAPQVIDRALQVHGIPQNDGGHDEIQATRTIALVFIGSVADFAETIEEHRAA